MSDDVAVFLLNLLNQVSLNAGADDFESSALLVIKAKKELAEGLAAEACPHEWTGEVCGPDSLASGLSVRLCRTCGETDARINGVPA